MSSHHGCNPAIRCFYIIININLPWEVLFDGGGFSKPVAYSIKAEKSSPLPKRKNSFNICKKKSIIIQNMILSVFETVTRTIIIIVNCRTIISWDTRRFTTV